MIIACRLLPRLLNLSVQRCMIQNNLKMCKFCTGNTTPTATKKKTRADKKSKNVIQFKPKSKYPVVKFWEGITVAEISKQTNRNLSLVFEAMSFVENCSQYSHPNSEINDRVTLYEIGKKLGYRAEFTQSKPQKDVSKKFKDLTKRPPPDHSLLVKKPPVVTIMGHVDHGKTTLLDSLRHTSVVSQEHGGITQHIGAFIVDLPGGRITFLDTPGHAAFHAMRSRGAHATDIVVLVVAADDGVMEQTVESIRFAREANVPIIVAINKIDKEKADAAEVKKQLLGYGIQLEELGGDIQAVNISALKNQNLDQLTEAILALAEVMEIGGDPNGPVEGIVLESRVDTCKGKLSTALIQRGTLKKGAILVAGTSWAKVRAMFDEKGRALSEVTPGIPAQIIGWRSLPLAGDVILEADSMKHAAEVVEYREKLNMAEKMDADSVVIQKKREEHFKKYREEMQERLMRGRRRKERSYFREKEIVWDTLPCLPIVLKGDVHGSVEALLNVIGTYKAHDECRLDVLNAAVGNITENDVILAETFNGLIYGFNVEIPLPIRKFAEERNVQIKMFNVIYHLIDDLKVEISSKLPLAREEDVIGEAVVLQEFLIKEGKKKVPVAGCKCTKGILKKGNCKVVRSEEVIYEGTLISLKHEKSDVESIKKDVECGLRVEDPTVSYLPGDIIVCFEENFVPRTTDWDPGF